MNDRIETKRRTRLHVYGDSILRGIVMEPESGKYIPMAGNDFSAFSAQDVDVVNKSKFGYTVCRGAALISRALDGNGEKPCEVMVVEYGGNDCNFDWAAVSRAPEEDHLPVTPLPEFRRQLYAVIGRLRSAGIRPVLTSLPPIDADRYLDRIAAAVPGTDRERILLWLGDTQMIYRYQEMYSAAVTETAYETGAVYVDLRSRFLDKHNYRALLCPDGIHPNEAGHALIREAFADAAERMLAPFAS